jgi:hypothetical protein
MNLPLHKSQSNSAREAQAADVTGTERILNVPTPKYATAADFLEIFTDEMHSLFLLSLLLTADIEIAEQCFADALEESMHDMDSFLEWSCFWARRTTIKHAIRLVTPVFNFRSHHNSISTECSPAPAKCNMIGAIFALDAFERFVFVISLVERQSDQNCALLLGCRPRDIETARSSAIRKLFDSDAGRNPAEEASDAWQAIRLRQKIRTNAAMVERESCC